MDQLSLRRVNILRIELSIDRCMQRSLDSSPVLCVFVNTGIRVVYISFVYRLCFLASLHLTFVVS